MASVEERPGGYYSVLGLASDASECAIRSAYRKLAMRWHPDKCGGKDKVDAKMKFQEIQEAYAGISCPVLSDVRKKQLYDNGLYDPEDDDEDIEGLSSFIGEMAGMMAEVQASEEGGKGSSFEELQHLFVSMFSADMTGLDDARSRLVGASVNLDRKRGWGWQEQSSFNGILEDSFPSRPSCENHGYRTASYDCGGVDFNASKKKKSSSSLQENSVSGNTTTQCDHFYLPF